jgi:hypothetical protein
MRRATLLAVLALAPAPAAARAASFEYLTSHAGAYSFAQDFKAAPALPDGLKTVQTYRWAVFDYDKVTVHPDRSYTSRHTRWIAATGNIKQVQVQGSDLPGGPFTTTSDCTIASSVTPVVSETGGANVSPVPVSQNPQISVGWAIPDYGTRRANDAPPFTVSGTPDCAGKFGSSFLVWTDSEPGGTVFSTLAPTKAMSEAFGGAQNIRYDDLPWDRKFENVTIDGTGSRPGFTGPATEQAQVKVDAIVGIERVDIPKPERSRPGKVNKIGALLLSEGFGTITTQTGPIGPPGSGGGEETVVVPGMGTGDVSLDVSGTVVNQRAQVRAGSSGTLLAHARARSTSTTRPVVLHIVPTAAGHALSAPHPALQARYVLKFRPRGSTRTISKSRIVTIPARV